MPDHDHEHHDDDDEHVDHDDHVNARLVDSDSVGEPTRFRTLHQLESGLRLLPAAPGDRGAVALIVRRRDGGRRETPDRIRLTPDAGVPGDAWGRQEDRQLEGQIAVMELAVAELIANGQPLTLFGDNLFLELDLRVGNLPPGSRLQVGGAVVEVTAKPHDGCRKFRGRFGAEALRFVAKAELRHRNLRGIYLRVVEAGDVVLRDLVRVIARG